MRSSLILITLAAGAAAQTTPLTCPTAEIPPASVHKSTVAARFRSMAVADGADAASVRASRAPKDAGSDAGALRVDCAAGPDLRI